jgi:hypothetical protein
MIERDIDRLLLACVKARYDREALDEAQRIVRDGQVSWERFLHQAAVHAVAPLMYDTVRNDGEPLPPWVREELRRSYYQTAARNALLFEELATIVRGFHQAKIPLILLKGAALAQGTYGNPALRPMSDLDLLVPSELMPRAEELLAKTGYTVLEGAESHLRHMTAI